MRLFLAEIKDRYSQENFRKLQKSFDVLEQKVNGGGASSTTYITERIPLDGSEPISGTIEPDTASTHDIGSTAKPLRGLYSDEVYVGANSLYIDGKQAISVDSTTNRLTYSNDPDQDLEVKSRGTGVLYIDSEGDIIITSSGNVTINGRAVVPSDFKQETFDIPSLTGNTITLAETPLSGSLLVLMNGSGLTEGASYDYTISGKDITFVSGSVPPTGVITVHYAY